MDRTERFEMRLSPEEKEIVKRASWMLRKPMAEYMRELLVNISAGVIRQQHGELTMVDLRHVAMNTVSDVVSVSETDPRQLTLDQPDIWNTIIEKTE